MSREVVPLERLQAVAALAPVDDSRNRQASNGRGSSSSQFRFSRLMIERWLQDRGRQFTIKSKDGHTLYVLSECPFDASHNRGEVVFTQQSNGRPGFKCQHDSCIDRHWPEARDAIGKPEPYHYDPPLNSQSKNGSASGQVKLQAGMLVKASDRDNFGTVVSDHGSTVFVSFTSLSGHTATVDLPKSQLSLTNGAPVDPSVEAYRVEVIGSAEFSAGDYKQSYLIDGVLVDGQPCMLGGPHKSLKTSLAIDLALSLGTGTPFLRHFPVSRQVTVAMLSGESGPGTLQETAKRIALERGLLLSSASVFWGFKLPQIANQTHLHALGEMLVDHEIDVVIIDPAYLCLLSGDTQGRQASNIFDMGSILQGLTEIGQQTGSTIILIHHLRKNPKNPFAVPELEDLSFSGFAEWTRQWLLVGRRSAYRPGTGEHQLWLNSPLKKL